MTDRFEEFHDLLTRGVPGYYEPSYIPIQEGGKRPIEGIPWKSNRFSYEKIRQWYEKGGNIAIAPREDDYLTVLDVDDPPSDNVNEWAPKETLVVRTQSRESFHLYYFGDGWNSMFDRGELRSDDVYCLVPGSTVDGSPYTIECDNLIELISASEYPDWVSRQSSHSSEQTSGGGADISSAWRWKRYWKDIEYCFEHVDEWNDGIYNTMVFFIKPRLEAMNLPPSTVDRELKSWVRQSCRNWDDRDYDRVYRGSIDVPAKRGFITNKPWGPNTWWNYE